MSRRYHAIEHIDPATDRLGNIEGRANTHEISGFVSRHGRDQIVEHVDELVFSLAYRKPTNRITIEFDLAKSGQRFPS